MTSFYKVLKARIKTSLKDVRDQDVMVGEGCNVATILSAGLQSKHARTAVDCWVRLIIVMFGSSGVTIF